MVLTVKQYDLLLPLIPGPYRVMVVLAQCLGLRVSEILDLQWCDLDFGSLVLRAHRGVVRGRVDHVKGEYSEDDVPLDPAVGQVLLGWQKTCPASWKDGCFRTRQPGGRIMRAKFARTTYGLLERSSGSDGSGGIRSGTRIVRCSMKLAHQ